MALLRELIQPAQFERCGDRSFPVLSMTMHDGIMLQSDRFKKSLASVDQSAYKVVRRNQLVVGFPIDEGVLYIQQVVDAGIMSPAYDVWNVDETKVDLRYFELCLHSPQSMMFYKTNLRGTTARRRSLPKDTLLSLPVPVPSMERQCEIASTLDRLQALIRLRQHQLCALDQLIKARFVEMFGEYQDTVQLSDVAEVTGGLTKNGNRDRLPFKMPYLRVANVSFASIDTTEMFSIGLTEEERLKTTLQYGDLLFVEGNGSPDQIGRVAIWRDEVVPCVHQNHIIKARLNESKMLPAFAMHYFMSQKGRDQIKKKAVSTSGLYTLSVSKISGFVMPCPPISKQSEFAVLVGQVDKSKLSLSQSLQIG